MSFLLEMSLAGALLILVIALIRALVMHKLPKKTFLVLWALVIFRLVIPVSIPSPASVFNLLGRFTAESTALPQNIPVPLVSNLAPQTAPAPSWQFQGSNSYTQVNINRLDTPVSVASLGSNPLLPAIQPLTLAYLTGLTLLTIYFAATYVKHRKEFMKSFPVKNAFIQRWLEENRLLMIRSISVRVSDKIDTPLTYGIIRPVILLPKSTNWANINELEYILAHELVHIQRFDSLTKIVMVAALCIHWFNPIVWAFCFLFNRDMEISCDEAVINMFGETSKKGYALTLIGLAARGNHFPTLLHNNFSKHAIEERITAIMKIKKVTFIGTLMALVLVTTTAVVFATTGTADDGTANMPPSQVSYQNDYANNDTNNDTYTPATVPQNTQSQFNIDIGEFFSGSPGANDITAEAAAQVGTDALKALFGTDVNGTTITMHFSGRVEAGTGRGQDISWSVDTLNRWTGELGMTADEILDYVRERSERDYTFEVGLDVDSLASIVGLTSDEFISVVMMVYIHERSQAVAKGWAYELGMTLDELFDYMMPYRNSEITHGYHEAPCLEDFANTVGIEIDQFIHVLGSVWNVSMTTWENHEQPSMWHGALLINNSYWAQFSFTVNAETGTLIGAHNNLWAPDMADIDERAPFMMSTTERPEQLTPEQNHKYSQLAMDIAQEIDLLGSAITKARVNTFVNGFNPATGEPTLGVMVEVQCINGNTVMLEFALLDDQAYLTNVHITDNPVWGSWGAHEFEWVPMSR